MTIAALILAPLVVLALIAYFREPLRDVVAVAFSGPYRAMLDLQAWASGAFRALNTWCRVQFVETTARHTVCKMIGAVLMLAMCAIFVYSDVTLLSASMAFFGNYSSFGSVGDPAWATGAALIASSTLWGLLFFEASALSSFAHWGDHFPGSEGARKGLIFTSIGMFTLTLAVIMSFGAIRVASLQADMAEQNAQLRAPVQNAQALSVGIGTELTGQLSGAGEGVLNSEQQDVAVASWVLYFAILGTAAVSLFGSAAAFWGALPILHLLVLSLIILGGCSFWILGAVAGLSGNILFGWPCRIAFVILDVIASLGEPLLRLLRISGRAKPVADGKSVADGLVAEGPSQEVSAAPRSNPAPSSNTTGDANPAPPSPAGARNANSRIHFDPFGQ